MLLDAALAFLLAPAPRATIQEPGPEPRVPALERILVLGASFSHGFGLEKDLGSRATLADVVEASLRAPHERVRARTSLIFFVDPGPTGKAQAAAAVAEKPTLVVGIDYLFWYGYGLFATEGDRLSMLEKGLAQLAAFECPVLVGDFPDVSDAARSAGGPGRAARTGLLVPEQVPTAEMRERLNDRLRAWAAERTNVVVVPLGDLVARFHTGADLEIRGNRWAGSVLPGLVQADRLHPTLEGTVVIWLGALDALVAARPDVPARAFEWKAERVVRGLRESFEARRPRTPRPAPAVGSGR